MSNVCIRRSRKIGDTGKYWGRLNLDRLDNWTFGDKQTGRYLLKFSWFPIERHVMVSGTASPDDPHLRRLLDETTGEQKPKT